MDKSIVHSIAFGGIVSALKSLRSASGEHLHFQGNGEIEVKFQKGYERRPNFQYNYQRSKFLNRRDKYVVAYNGSYHIILRLNNRSEVVIYRKALEKMVGKYTEDVINELDRILSKLYDSITIEDVCTADLVDLGAGRHSNHVRLVNEY